MLDEDGVTGQVAVDDGRVTGMQVAGERRERLQEASREV